MPWTAYSTHITFLMFPWGIRLTAAVQNNGVINAGTVGMSNLPGRVSTICSQSHSLGEQQTCRAAQHRELSQPLRQRCCSAPLSVVLCSQGKVAGLKNRRKCSLLDTAFSVGLGRAWKMELTSEMSVQIIPQLACVGHWLLKSRLQLSCPEIKIFILKIWKCWKPVSHIQDNLNIDILYKLSKKKAFEFHLDIDLLYFKIFLI